MARLPGKLTQKEVENEKRPGKYLDSAGLYLQVRPAVSGGVSKSWLYRYQIAGVTLVKSGPNAGKVCSYEMGLGPFPTIGLAEARDEAHRCRLQVLKGIDPAAARDAAKAEKLAASGEFQTFREVAEACFRGESKNFTNAKHAAQWAYTLKTFCYPKIGNLPISKVDTSHVIRILEQPINIGTAKRPQLEPLWTAMPETASRLRGRLERIFGWAKARKLRHGENPAAWRDNLKFALPNIPRLARIKHHPAMPFPEVSAFVRELRQQEGIAARALEFTILTAARTGEVIGARWDEIDEERKVWTVPASRMKAKREHRVPLASRALEILGELRELEIPAGFIFPGRAGGVGLSNMSMLKVLERVGRDDVTTHGFRSCFRDWAAERTDFQNHVVEAALAHAIADKVEAAYRRGDLFDKRRRLMDAWAAFLEKPAATVTAIDVKRRSAAQ